MKKQAPVIQTSTKKQLQAVAPTKKTAAKKAPAKKAATPAATKPAVTRAAPLAGSGATRDARGFETWTAEDLVRFERGFPNFIELVEGHPDDKKLLKSLAKTASGVDQVYGFEWPAEVARAYTHIFGSLGDKNPSEVEKQVLEWTPPAGPPTEATLKKMLKDCMPGESTYAGWKAPPAFYAMEHFLGSEVTALAIVERLAGYTKTQWAEKVYDDDKHGRIAINCLAYMWLRCDASARKRVQTALDAVLAKRPAKDERTEFAREAFAKTTKLRKDWASDEEDKFGLHYLDVRDFYVNGCDKLLTVPLMPAFGKIRDFSKRVMLEWVDHLGRIKHPGVVRVLVSFGAYRSATPAVKAWIDAHADYVASVLPRFADDPEVKKGLSALDMVTPGAAAPAGKKPKAKPKLSAFATAQRVFEELEKTLPKAFPDQEKVTALIQAAVDECREAARDEGETYLEVHFVNLWAESDFNTTEEQFAQLSEAYEEVVVDG